MLSVSSCGQDVVDLLWFPSSLYTCGHQMVFLLPYSISQIQFIMFYVRINYLKRTSFANSEPT